jgi:hypothetical protein
MAGSVAILANPMSGRDVRRMAARASVSTNEMKRDLVARIATGLDAVGVDEILVMREPYRLASGALELMPLRAKVRVLDVGLTHSAADTVAFVQAVREAGCAMIVSLGGDGTNRIIARTWPQAPLLPLSTGTNNVFPVFAEATAAGLAAGLVARGAIPLPDAASRCKVIRVRAAGWEDIGVIDAVLLRDDHTGNLLPYDPARLAALVLTRGEPDSVGMSPIGGYIDPVGFDDNCGLALRCGVSDGPLLRTLQVPVSPGLFGTVQVQSCERLGLGEPFQFVGPGVVAFDGDREHSLSPGEIVQVTVDRSGPWVLDIGRCLRLAAGRGLLG